MNKPNPSKVLDDLIEDIAGRDLHVEGALVGAILQAHYTRMLCDNVHALQKAVEELDRTVYNLKVYVGG